MITRDNPSILVIDDEPTILQLFRRVFEKNGVRVVTSTNANEGLALISDMDLDVVVLDIILPDANGLETFERIREIDPRIRAVISTLEAPGLERARDLDGAAATGPLSGRSSRG